VQVHVRGLRHLYGGHGPGRVALDVAELRVESHAKLCLIGGSGSGKTTLLNVLAGVLVPSAGEVSVGEQSLFRLNEAERDIFRARHIGCVFQTLNLLLGLSVLENLTLAQHFAGIPHARARRRALELLAQLGLADRAGARPVQLSLGEQQRVAIARAVCKGPGLVLADEPTASLDDDNARASIDLLFDACRASTLIVASHDARLIERFETVQRLAALRGTAG
jgi:putative ABC transport system ATP-binding protein